MFRLRFKYQRNSIKSMKNFRGLSGQPKPNVRGVIITASGGVEKNTKKNRLFAAAVARENYKESL